MPTALEGTFLFLKLFTRLFRFRFEFQILDDMFGSLRHHVADVVKAFAPRTACNLMEITRGQNSRLVTTVLAELREKHRSNGHVDSNAERIGAANNLKQPLLCEFFAENSVFR